MLKDKLWYVAHPYTGNELENFNDVNKICAQLAALGVKFYSPLSMTHPIHLAGVEMGVIASNEYELYMKLDEIFVNRCDGLILCDGWKDSKGCCYELGLFKSMKKPVWQVGEFLSKVITEKGDGS